MSFYNAELHSNSFLKFNDNFIDDVIALEFKITIILLYCILSYYPADCWCIVYLYGYMVYIITSKLILYEHYFYCFEKNCINQYELVFKLVYLEYTVHFICFVYKNVCQNICKKNLNYQFKKIIQVCNVKLM